MTLIGLAYVSIAVKEMTDEDLKAILEVARNFNAQNNITGLLLYRDGLFVQALEGEAEVVDALFAKIRQDKRHKNIIVVYRNAIQGRSFQQWTMGFNKITDSEVAQVHGLNDFLQGRQEDMTFFSAYPSHATDLLGAFKDKGLYF